MALHAAATPGPWVPCHDVKGDIAPFLEGKNRWIFGEYFDPEKKCDGFQSPSFVDLEYIASACNAVPALVQYINELEVQVKRGSAEEVTA